MKRELAFMGKIAQSSLSRRMNQPSSPWHVVLFPTYSCQLKCSMCRLWEAYRKDPTLQAKELAAAEYRKVFHSAGFVPYVSIVGGEPFLRKDFLQILEAITEESSPLVLALTTNGFLTEKIREDVEAAMPGCSRRNVRMNIQVSVDGSCKSHDSIRGVKGSYDRARKSFMMLKGLEKRHSNLSTGIQITVANHNISTMKESYARITEDFSPDVCSIAIADKVFSSSRKDISADSPALRNALLRLKMPKPGKNIPLVSRILRRAYYKSAGNNLFLGCYAGSSSATIGPSGDVYPCPDMLFASRKIGNVRDSSYSIKNALQSVEAAEARGIIMRKGCRCNAVCLSQVNMMSSLSGMLRIISASIGEIYDTI
jgi:radical SAM protein with 4Fe4S-binding SPASM domain